MIPYHRAGMLYPSKWPLDTVHAMMSGWLVGKAETTARAYDADVRCFVIWRGAPNTVEAMRDLLDGGAARASRILHEYYLALQATSNLAEGTMRRRVLTLFSFFDEYGPSIGWSPDRPEFSDAAPLWASPLPILSPRDVSLLLRRASNTRDVLIIRLAYDLAMKAQTMQGLVLGRNVIIETDGTPYYISSKEPQAFPEPTAAALEAWLTTRGRAAAPLLVKFRSDGGSGLPMKGYHINRALRQLGESVGLPGVTVARIRTASLSAAARLLKDPVQVATFGGCRVRTALAYVQKAPGYTASDTARKVAGDLR